MAKSSTSSRKSKSGIISLDKGKHQSGEIFRKIKFRKLMIKQAGEGAVYIPFCGEGDIAIETYSKRKVFASDIDDKKTSVLEEKHKDAIVITCDCDVWPFYQYKDKFAIADFDSWAYPYDSFHAFWRGAEKAFPLVMFFTDGQLGPLTRFGNLHKPDGSKLRGLPLAERRKLRNFYWRRVVLDWWKGFCAKENLKILRSKYYIAAGGRMIYWGTVVDER